MSAASIGNPYTRGIADFVSALRYEAIPAEVTARIKLLILDALGCGIYGAGLEWSRILQRRLTDLDTMRQCAIWGTGLKLSAPHAALVNGTQVQGFELDDMHDLGMLHSGSVVLPALISITETGPAMSGREFLAAAVAGYEIGPRAGMCMGNQHPAQGWHSGATIGVFGAASAAARGLGLDAGKTVHALGIAGTQACGLLAAQFGSMVKRMHGGRASQSGLYGAHLADAGFTGILNVFESEYGGFCTTFSRSTDRFDLSRLTAGLGSVWQTMGFTLKFYSTASSTHATLDALCEMRDERHFTARDVRSIKVQSSEFSVHHAGWKYVPQSLTSAQMNLSYCVATLLLEGACFVNQFREEMLADPARLALAAKVEMVEDPAITARGPKFRKMARVEVELNDGTHLHRELPGPRSSSTNLISASSVVGKFNQLTEGAMPSAQRDRLCESVLQLETLDDAAQLARLLSV